MTTQRLLLDHLPGGKYHSEVVDTIIVQETATVPTTNVSPERDFAILDRMLRGKPNANLIAIESVILYSQNQTSSWLGKQTVDERSKLLKAARLRVPVVRARDKGRSEKLG